MKRLLNSSKFWLSVIGSVFGVIYDFFIIFITLIILTVYKYKI